MKITIETKSFALVKRVLDTLMDYEQVDREVRASWRVDGDDSVAGAGSAAEPATDKGSGGDYEDMQKIFDRFEEGLRGEPFLAVEGAVGPADVKAGAEGSSEHSAPLRSGPCSGFSVGL